jgi:hypothetical protein
MDYFYSLEPSLIHSHGGHASLTPFHIVSLQYAEIMAHFCTAMVQILTL